MPTYEYVCKDCSHEFEAFQSIKDDPLTKCPKCGKNEAKRQISLGGGFILKGGGWYSDLYGSSKPGTSAESSSSDAATSETSTASESSSSSDTSSSSSDGSSSGSGGDSSSASSTSNSTSTGDGGKDSS